MKFATICSGIGAPEAAFSRLGWQSVFCAEIEPFPCAVLQYHFPNTPNYGDITRYSEWPDESFDLLCGGTPCQGFSIAGLRKGLDDERSNLAIDFIKIAAKYRPRWLVWENVPGCFSINEGRDFASFLGGLTGRKIEVPGGWQNTGICAGIPDAYGVAWRVLDTEYVRVEHYPRAIPQRRERVFLVGYLGNWRPSAAVLLERESMQGHTAPRRSAGKGSSHCVAPCVGASGRGFDRSGDTRGQDCVVAAPIRTSPYCDNDGQGIPLVAACDTSRQTRQDAETQDFIPFDTTQITSKENRSQPKAGDPCHPVSSRAHPPALAFPERLSSTQCASSENVACAIGAENPTAVAFRACVGAIQHRMAVRRLTPTEVERLFGFPDGWTAITYRGKPAKDSPRYRSLGNSISLNCLEWLAQRIEIVESLTTPNPSVPPAVSSRALAGPQRMGCRVSRSS